MANSSDTFYNTVAVFGIISILVYFFLSRTYRQPTEAQARARAAGTSTGNAGFARNNDGTTGSGINNSHAVNSSKMTTNERCLRVPPHVSEASGKIAVNNGANILSDGIVAFRHTLAAFEEQSLIEDEIVQNRTDRARVLSRLLDDSSNGGVSINAPPAKGSTVVVAVRFEDIDCPKLRRILYLLGTFYNLFTIIVIETKEQFIGQERDDVINRLRGTDDGVAKRHLSSSILPSHRIIAATSIAGRVAFVRQLERIELVIDYDVEVKKLLSRFGHKVLICGSAQGSSLPGSTSQLGNALL